MNELKLELLNYKDKVLHFDGLNLQKFSKKQQTPFYLYSKNRIIHNLKEYQDSLSGLDYLICYSVKANSSLSILSLLGKHGCGFDIVSSGELNKSIKAKGDTSKIVFSGVGKTREEIELAIKNDILCFNVESESELNEINKLASHSGQKVRVAIRVNPEIDAKTHSYIATGLSDSKFGLDQKTAVQLYKTASQYEHVVIKGVAFHIGSQITKLAPFEASLEKVVGLIKELKKHNIELEHINIGGGLGIKYDQETPPTKNELVNSVKKHLQPLGMKVILEPGRSIVGDAGIIVSRVLYNKKTPSKNFLIMDLGMNDFIRPSLYGAYHSIKVVMDSKDNSDMYDIVGPICESADFIGEKRKLSYNHRGDNNFLVVENAGAYGFVLSSNYNSRSRPSEWMIVDGEAKCIRTRETLDQLILNENLNV